MGIIIETIQRPNYFKYIPEFNKDGTEKHIVLNGAWFHEITWTPEGEICSEPNCEINKR